MPVIPILPSVDSSNALQKIIDNQGNNSATFQFDPDCHITITSRIRLYNNQEFDGHGAAFELMEHARTTIFGEQIPLIGSKFSNNITCLKIHDLKFKGNRDTQKYIPDQKSPWGKGYHTFINLGVLKNPIPSNVTDCEFYNLDFSDNLGDGLTIYGGSNIVTRDITGHRGGHDIVCYVCVSGGEIARIKADLAVNAGARTRSCFDIKIHDCELNGNTGIAYCPGIQIESITPNKTSDLIEVYSNKISGTYGPGIWIIGDVPNNGIAQVHHNLLANCGQMPAGNKIAGVGAVVYDGFNVDLKNNTVVNSKGYGFLAGTYAGGTKYPYKATIRKNIIVGTKVSNYPGLMSGAALADLTGRYSISASENCLNGNVTNYHKVTSSSDVLADPCFMGPDNYHLKSMPKAPCVFKEGYELGCYDGTIGAAEYIPPYPPAVTISQGTPELLKALVAFWIERGDIEPSDIVGYKNMEG